jgi:hypothetical protein
VFCGVSGVWLGAAGGFLTGLLLSLVLSGLAAWMALAAPDASVPGGAAGRDRAPARGAVPFLAPLLAPGRAASAGAPAAPAQRPAADFKFSPPVLPPAPLLGGGSELEVLRGCLSEDLDQIKRLHALALDLKGNLGELASRVGVAAHQNALLLEGAERDGSQVAAEIQALVGVKEALRQGTQVIDDLAQSSKEVGPVIESIFVVARKTNMLALNAAIEAARAGEQGRGFAVVAEEVRRLAEAATASTQKVERFVEGLRERTSSAIQVLQGAARIEDTIPVVYRISDAFMSLVPAVEGANQSLGELSQLVEENVREVGLLREAAEAGMAATIDSIARVDALIERNPGRR